MQGSDSGELRVPVNKNMQIHCAKVHQLKYLSFLAGGVPPAQPIDCRDEE